jgi:ERCC4-type nuclease
MVANEASQPFRLPALKSLGDLAGAEPILVVDTREQDPLVFTRMQSVRDTLTSGDYSIRGMEEFFSVERKSIPDLVACCMSEQRQRFERELHRLRGYRFSRLLVVGDESEIREHRYQSNISPKAVLGSLWAFEARYIPVVWSATPETAARLIERWAFYFTREIIEAVNDLWRCLPQKTT